MLGISEYAVIALSGTLLVGGLYGKAEIAELKLELSQCTVIKLNNQTLRGSIKTQNKAILSLKVDLNASNYRWNNRTPSVEVVERWRTRYVDSNNSEGGNCEENNNILNAIRDYGY